MKKLFFLLNIIIMFPVSLSNIGVRTPIVSPVGSSIAFSPVMVTPVMDLNNTEVSITSSPSLLPLSPNFSIAVNGFSAPPVYSIKQKPKQKSVESQTQSESPKPEENPPAEPSSGGGINDTINVMQILNADDMANRLPPDMQVQMETDPTQVRPLGNVYGPPIVAAPFGAIGLMTPQSLKVPLPIDTKIPAMLPITGITPIAGFPLISGGKYVSYDEILTSLRNEPNNVKHKQSGGSRVVSYSELLHHVRTMN